MVSVLDLSHYGDCLGGQCIGGGWFLLFTNLVVVAWI